MVVYAVVTGAQKISKSERNVEWNMTFKGHIVFAKSKRNTVIICTYFCWQYLFFIASSSQATLAITATTKLPREPSKILLSC